jgi:hypothetical protein
MVEIEREGEMYVLTSRVLGSSRAADLSAFDRVQHVWRRNRENGVVELVLDSSGRVVGRIEQVAETLDREELEYYLGVLAEECDRLEYLLTGRDEA